MLVDFWTYSCINCLRSIPYVRAWADKYRDQGLVVIGVHAPEFAFEKSPANVEKAIADLKIDYPVALDNDYTIWRAFHNEYWPAHYFIDAQGRIRHHHFGEGDYAESERVHPAIAGRGGPQDRGVPARQGLGEGGGSGGGYGRRPVAGDLYRLRPRREFRLARRRRGGRGSRLCRRRAAAQRMGPRRRLAHRRGAGDARSSPTARSCSASTRAICIWCWRRARTASRCASR